MRTRFMKRSIWYFLYGCCFGLLLDYIYNKFIKTQYQFIGHDVSPSHYQIEKHAIFNDLKYLYEKNSKEAYRLSQQVRVLCWVSTQEKSLLSKAQAIKDTWGKHCNILVFFSSKENDQFPAIKLEVSEGIPIFVCAIIILQIYFTNLWTPMQ